MNDLRDQFALAALPALIAEFPLRGDKSVVSALAYEYADAMIKAREISKSTNTKKGKR